MQTLARAIVIASLALPGHALAQEAEGTLSLELNDAADTESGNCRLTYVGVNGTDVSLERTEYEVAIFDAEGTVDRLLLLKFGALVPGKTRILQFELPQTQCADISRIVINDVSACTEAGGADSGACMSALSPSSRTPIQFGI